MTGKVTVDKAVVLKESSPTSATQVRLSLSMLVGDPEPCV